MKWDGRIHFIFTVHCTTVYKGVINAWHYHPSSSSDGSRVHINPDATGSTHSNTKSETSQCPRNMATICIEQLRFDWQCEAKILNAYGITAASSASSVVVHCEHISRYEGRAVSHSLTHDTFMWLQYRLLTMQHFVSLPDGCGKKSVAAVFRFLSCLSGVVNEWQLNTFLSEVIYCFYFTVSAWLCLYEITVHVLAYGCWFSAGVERWRRPFSMEAPNRKSACVQISSIHFTAGHRQWSSLINQQIDFRIVFG